METENGLKKIVNIPLILVLIYMILTIFFIPSQGICLEKLEKKQMKAETGQAGITMGLDGVAMVHTADSVKFIDSQDPEPGYVAFENIKGLGTFSTGAKDIDGDGNAGAITIDIGNVINSDSTSADDIPLVFLGCPDWNQNIIINIGNINWCGKNLGSADIINFSLPVWRAYIGSYNGAGIDFELGFRTRVEEIRFNYGSSGEKLSVSGLALSGGFNGNPEDDPSTWKPVGEFKVGDAMNLTPNPASIDIGVRESTDGTTDDPDPFVKMNLSASGSIRADKIQFGSADFGQMAIDGIKIHKMTVEFPGRGLGAGR